jgi:hypothetical protein
MQRMLVCMRNSETLEYFQRANEDLGSEFGLGYFTEQARPPRKAGIPPIDNGNPLRDSNPVDGRKLRRISATSSQLYISKGKCLEGCMCRCHGTAKYQLPFKFKQIFQRLFPKVKSEPVLVRNCSTLDCRKIRLRHQRLFVVVHAAFVNKVIVLAAISRGLRLKLQIKYYPVVPETSDIIQSALTGNIELVQKLIRLGKATVNDTSEFGWSVLHVSKTPTLINKFN